MNTIYLHRDDIVEILEVLKDFKDVQTFKLIHDNSSGIGSTVMIEFPHILEGREVSITACISSVENW